MVRRDQPSRSVLRMGSTGVDVVSEWTSGKTSFKLDAFSGSALKRVGTLTVKGDLSFRVEREFQRACAQLLALVEKHNKGEAQDLLVDLSGVSFICSSCIGSLFLLQDNARTRHVNLRVRLGRKIAPICKMMGLEELVDVEVERPETGSSADQG